MKKIISVITFGLVVLPMMANAQWVSQSEDDIFTGGKKSSIFITTNDYSLNSAFVFDCTSDSLSFAYIEKSKSSDDTSVPIDMFVKVDDGKVVKFDATYYRRNNDYFQAETSDRDGILSVLQDAVKAKSKIIVGLSSKHTDNKHSFTANVSGSTKAVNDFIKACKIELKDDAKI
ncbi:hypothetical protein [Pectobacterium carotovorum]|uniref:hypothetical protein n=1 Tax=Pectobacterium carotovorum TaxID=554 RepID=UPI003018603B